MPPKRGSSDVASDSSSSDAEMPQLLPVARAPVEEAREPPTRAPDYRAELEALGNDTIEGLYEAARKRPHLFRLLNRYMRVRHRVEILEIGDSGDGVMTIHVGEGQPAPGRRCRWDGTFWTKSQTLRWALQEKKASLLWALGFWERDFER